MDHRLDLSFTARIGTLLVGSVRLSPIDRPSKALLLGPLTVEPPFRERGIGLALIERALADAKLKGHRLVVLVGDEPYYGKSGFKRIPKGRATMPGPVDPARLLVCELAEGAFEASPDRSGRMVRLDRRPRTSAMSVIGFAAGTVAG